jgi:DNA repair exonuclease SbcCD ATPase subunit
LVLVLASAPRVAPGGDGLNNPHDAVRRILMLVKALSSVLGWHLADTNSSQLSERARETFERQAQWLDNQHDFTIKRHAVSASAAPATAGPHLKELFTNRANNSDRLNAILVEWQSEESTMENLEWLHKHMRTRLSGAPHRNPYATISSLPDVRDNATATRDGRAALDLVYEAAEVVRGLEARAKEFENHARDLAEKAYEKLKLAETRIHELEAQQRAVEACLNGAREKLHEAAEALKRERARVAAAENQLPELEMRARTAEARAEECEKTLAGIEDAIRIEILKQRPPASYPSNAA